MHLLHIKRTVVCKSPPKAAALLRFLLLIHLVVHQENISISGPRSWYLSSEDAAQQEKMVCSVTESAIIERSLSFRSWETEASQTADARDGDEEGRTPKPSSGTSTLKTAVPVPDLMLPQHVPDYFSSPKPLQELDAAATKLQKVYKSYRTRRNLADCAVVIEELWWKALDFACLKHSSVSFFNVEKHETAASRWSRALTRVAKVGKGLSKDEKAQKLALQHWLEAIDPRHRYGHNLHLYYDIWFESQSTQPFFYWLDVGDGRELSLDKCSRTKLNSQCIRYLGPNEREAFEVIVQNGKLVYKQTEDFVNTTEGSKWIFVLSTTRSLYVGQKKKGNFQHSSFLSGGATTAAGRLVAKEGILQAIWPYSGHYLPTEENFKEFISFLQDNNVDLSNVKRCSVDDDEYPGANKENCMLSQAPKAKEVSLAAEPAKEASDMADVAQKTMALEFSRRVSAKWTSGAGPRIGCVREYSADLRTKALEHVNLSPRVVLSPVQGSKVPIPSPRPSPKLRLSPKLQFMGIPTPTVSLTLPKHRKG